MNKPFAPPPPPPSRLPIDFETELGPLPLTGDLPAGLRGTLVRNGPNPRVPAEGVHWFAGDGMLHAFGIEDGAVHYRNRWVRTARFEYADRTGLNPVGSALVAPGEAQALAEDNGSANTNVIAHAGRMLALEEAHLPIAVEPDTLATLGVETFDGRLSGPFTAHPKTDPRSGDLLFFGYGTPEPLSRGMSFGVLSPQGQLTRFERFEAPYASMVHDFAITEDFVLLPVLPLTASRERAESGRPPFAWEPEHGTRVGLMPRAGTSVDMVWWSGPACYVFHVMNAWQSDGFVFADVFQFDKPPLFPMPDGSPAGGPDEPGRLVRWRFDLNDAKREFSQTVLCDISGEFPRIDERRTGLPYRHGWFAGHTNRADGTLRRQSSLVHIDHAAPSADVFTFDAEDRVSEPVFVPRSDAEGDGWLLATVWRSAHDTSDLVVFDARDVAAGPLCAAALPHRVPDGFHGNWFAAPARTGRS